MTQHADGRPEIDVSPQSPPRSAEGRASSNAWPPESLRGVLPVFQTPFYDDESIDFPTLDREIDWLFDRGAQGVVMAMVSEVLRLSTDERERMTEHVCRRTAARGPCVISVGAESGRVSERLARQAEAAGASALMAIPPISVSLPEREVLAYYERILGSVSIPVIVQDASGYVGRPLPIAVQARILESFGDRVLFKPEAQPLSQNVSALRDATAGRARIFEGSGGIALVDSYRRGIVGTMPGADLIDGIVSLWRALESRDDRRAYSLSLPISSLISIQNSLDAYLAVEKHLLVRQGIFRNTVVRGPVGYRLDHETRSEVDRLFDLLQEAIGLP